MFRNMDTLFLLTALLVFVVVDAQDEAHCKLSPQNTMCMFREGSGPTKQRRGVDANAIQDIVDGHNKLRAKVANGQQSGQPTASNMQELTWNNGLAQVAQRWADQCQFGHDQNRVTPEFPKYVGQNVAQTSGLAADNSTQFNSAIDMWFGEVKGFNSDGVASYVFSTASGHYTQVVWANTYAIGCGFALCDRDMNYYVCNYGPGGNVAGEPIYLTGTACSKCKSGCSTKYPGLCVTTSR